MDDTEVELDEGVTIEVEVVTETRWLVVEAMVEDAREVVIEVEDVDRTAVLLTTEPRAGQFRRRYSGNALKGLPLTSSP